jgi:DNA-directed RNA polymerase specialized sigma subunit
MLLVKALDKYDNTKNASFETFFTTYVRSWVHMELLKQNMQKRGEELFVLSETYRLKGGKIDYNVMDEVGDLDNLSPDEYDFQLKLFEFIDKELDKMKNGDYTKSFLFENKNHADIARENGVSTSYVNIINKTNRLKLKELLEMNGYLDNLDKRLNRLVEEFKL